MFGEIKQVARRSWGVAGARARQHLHAQHLSPTDISIFLFIYTFQTKIAFTTATYLEILLSRITVRICAAGLRVFSWKNGEMGSRVSAAAADGDSRRILDRSERAHISSALHVRRTFSYYYRIRGIMPNFCCIKCKTPCYTARNTLVSTAPHEWKC